MFTVNWSNLCSGLIGTIVGSAITWVLYYKQRNDSLIDMLQVKFSELFSTLTKVRRAHVYTTNSINRVDYVYHCSLVEELDTLNRYLDLLLTDCMQKTKIIQVVTDYKRRLKDELETWKKQFKDQYFNKEKNFYSTLDPITQERTMKTNLDQNIHSLGLQLKDKEPKFIELENEFLQLSKEYLKQIKFCV